MQDNNPKSLEPSIRRIGREIFERAEAAAPSALSMEFWQKAALDWLTRDDDLKLRLFRFIEVFPALRSDASIARHLKEYLGDENRDGEPLPLPLQAALAFKREGSSYARWVACVTRFACARMARQFVCGATPKEAVASVKRLRRMGMAFTLDVLGETVIGDHVAQAHHAIYMQLVEELARVAPGWTAAPLVDDAPWGPLPRVNISTKLTSLVTKFDSLDVRAATERVLDRVRPLFRAARDRGVFMNIDTEHFAVKDRTFDIVLDALEEPKFRDWPDCGLVIQAYLRDAGRDLERVIAWARRRETPITVRLVKGAYWDYEVMHAILTGRPFPVFTRKSHSDAEFERLARIMLENTDAIRPAFATHNVRSIAAVLAMERALDLPPRTLEIQMLTGMGDPLKRAVVGLHQRLRVYAPFGDFLRGMAYLIRRLIENTSNESFLRQGFTEHTPVDELLQNPARTGGTPMLPNQAQPFTDDPRACPDQYRRIIVDPEGEETADMPPFEYETETDLGRPENRKSMEAALAEVNRRFGERYPAIIDNQEVQAAGWHESRDPSNPNSIVGETADCDVSIADRAVDAARKAAESWSETPSEMRAAVLQSAADRLHETRFEAAAWQVYEVGKPWREAMGDVMETIDYLRFYAREMARLGSRARHRDYPGESNTYVYQPRGVVAVISPFCFPTALLAGMTSAALVTGNTVVIKPARSAGVCAARFVRLMIDSGLPSGVLNFVPGGGETVGEHLASHPDVDMIAFTGSREVGCRIIQLARSPDPGRNAFKHVLCEMGGKNALIIDDDADLDEGVQATIASAFGYAGQKCTACSRAIVLNDVYDDFLAKLTEAVRPIRPASADQPGTSFGPVIDAAAVDRLQQYIEIGRAEARCVLDGTESSPNVGGGLSGSTESSARSNGHFIAPTIFADVPPDARIAHDEIFGPLLAVIRARDFDQAIDIANNTAYALTGGVYSRSPSHIEQAKRRLRAGVIYINRRITESRVDRQPFGGFGLSGLGTKAGGPDYLQQFMLPRTVSENTMRHGFAPVATPPPGKHPREQRPVSLQ